MIRQPAILAAAFLAVSFFVAPASADERTLTATPTPAVNQNITLIASASSGGIKSGTVIILSDRGIHTTASGDVSMKLTQMSAPNPFCMVR